MDCPLCDEAKYALQKIEAKLPFIEVEEIDITNNLGLYTKYKFKIPVLELDGRQLFSQQINGKQLLWQLRWYRFLSRFA